MRYDWNFKITDAETLEVVDSGVLRDMAFDEADEFLKLIRNETGDSFTAIASTEDGRSFISLATLADELEMLAHAKEMKEKGYVWVEDENYGFEGWVRG